MRKLAVLAVLLLVGCSSQDAIGEDPGPTAPQAPASTASMDTASWRELRFGDLRLNYPDGWAAEAVAAGSDPSGRDAVWQLSNALGPVAAFSADGAPEAREMEPVEARELSWVPHPADFAADAVVATELTGTDSNCQVRVFISDKAAAERAQHTPTLAVFHPVEDRFAFFESAASFAPPGADCRDGARKLRDSIDYQQLVAVMLSVRPA